MFSSKKNIIVGIFYRAPTSSLKLFNQKLETTLDIIQRETKYSYIMGDFNVNCIEEFSDSNMYSQQFINMFLSHYYLKLINIPTRITQNNASLLDNIYATDPQVGNNGVLTSDISDHYSIFTIRQDVEPKILDKYRYKREFTNKNISKFKKKLCNLDWNTTLISDSAKLDFSCFFSIITDLFNSSFPMKKIKITYSNKNPWIRRKLKDEIVKREKLHAKSKKTPTEANILEYKEYNLRTKILQTSELQRETISENNLIYNLMIWENF